MPCLLSGENYASALLQFVCVLNNPISVFFSVSAHHAPTACIIEGKEKISNNGSGRFHAKKLHENVSFFLMKSGKEI